MRNSLYLASITIALACTSITAQQQPLAAKSTPASAPSATTHAIPPADNPVADPKAVVTVGNARFTVLTPQ